ncbi:MAG: thiamine diphosphokinase [Bacillota bacterium]
MKSKQAVIALNGSLLSAPGFYEEIAERSSLLIAADGGIKLYEQIEKDPHYLIGDFDSISPDLLDSLEKRGVKLEKYPVKKDKTDAELCLDYCKKLGYSKVVILAGLGGRLDQQLANIFLLEYSLEQQIMAKIKEEDIEIGLIDEYKKISGFQGWGLSLLPLDKKITNLTISGALYDTENLDLDRSMTRGISNQIKEDEVEITISQGRLIYILQRNIK